MPFTVSTINDEWVAILNATGEGIHFNAADALKLADDLRGAAVELQDKYPTWINIDTAKWIESAVAVDDNRPVLYTPIIFNDEYGPVCIGTDGYRIHGTFMQDQFPDNAVCEPAGLDKGTVLSMVNRTGFHTIAVNTESLFMALQEIRPAAIKNPQGSILIEYDYDERSMTVCALSDNRKVNVLVDYERSAPIAFKMAFSIEYLLAALRGMGRGWFELGYRDSKSFIRMSRGSTRFAILMPMAISE